MRPKVCAYQGQAHRACFIRHTPGGSSSSTHLSTPGALWVWEAPPELKSIRPPVHPIEGSLASIGLKPIPSPSPPTGMTGKVIHLSFV